MRRAGAEHACGAPSRQLPLAARRAERAAAAHCFLAPNACLANTSPNASLTQNVFETLIGKKQQLQLATQVCKMILKARLRDAGAEDATGWLAGWGRSADWTAGDKDPRPRCPPAPQIDDVIKPAEYE